MWDPPLPGHVSRAGVRELGVLPTFLLTSGSTSADGKSPANLGLRPHEKVLFVTELPTCIATTESPIDFDPSAVHLLIPGSCFPLQCCQVGNPALSETLPSVQADFDLDLV